MCQSSGFEELKSQRLHESKAAAIFAFVVNSSLTGLNG